MSEGGWWLSTPGGEAEGPFSAEELRSRAATGKVGRGTRVWSPSAGAWLPFHSTVLGFRPGRPVGKGFFAFLVLQSLAFLAVWIGIVLLLRSENDLGLPRHIASPFWAASGIALAILSVGSLLAWWRASNALAASAELAAVLRVAAMLFLVVGLALASFEIRAAQVMIPVQNAVSDWLFEAGLDKSSGDIRLDGRIGPGFGRSVEALLAQAPTPTTIEITSSGGLLNEAMIAARAIEAQGDVTVVARDSCASACIIVLMGGQTRLADVDMPLEFHATAAVTPIKDRFFAWSVKDEGAKADAYLVTRGVPKELLETADRIGPGKVYAIPAPLAVGHGVLTGVLDGDRRLGKVEIEARARPQQAYVDSAF